MKHSKITAIVLTLCMLVTLMVVAPTAASATTTDANFVKDGSFEKWGATGEYDDRVWKKNLPSLRQTVTNEETGEEETVYTTTTAYLEPSSAEKATGLYSMKFAAVDTPVLTSTHSLYYKVSDLDAGDTVKLSLKYYVKQLDGGENAKYRFIPRLVTTGGALFSNYDFKKATTNTWEEWVITGVVTEAIEASGIYMHFEVYGSTDFEIYLDDFKAEKVEIEVDDNIITNGDFENGADGWDTKSNGTSLIKEDTDGNHYLECTQSFTHRYVRQLSGMEAGASYTLIFDVCSQGSFARIDNESSAVIALDAYNTNGAWESKFFTFDAPADKFPFRFMFSGTATEGSYVRFDNISLVKTDTLAAKVLNGDFERRLLGWNKTANDGTIETITENGNSYLKLSDGIGGKNQTYVTQTVSGLDSSKTYTLRLDVLSESSNVDGGSGSYVYKQGSAHVDGVSMFSKLTTYGKWHRYQVSFSGKTSFDLRLMCFNPDNDNSAAYTLFDNIVIEEVVSDGNLVSNGSFEYGHNGFGVYSGRYGITSGNYGYWKLATSYVDSPIVSQSRDSIEGDFSLKVNRAADTASWSGARKDVTYEAGATYLFTMYVKNISFVDDTATNEGIHIYMSNPATDLVYHAESMPVGEWKCIQWLYTPAAASGFFDIRVWGRGEVLIDNVSCRKLTGPVVNYTTSSGVAASNLVDGGKVSFIMPVTAADQGNVYALALYNRNGNNKTLLNVKAQTITDANVTAGYASFELQADALGADFADVNYAKLITMKGGSYDAIQEYDLLVKAAQ